MKAARATAAALVSLALGGCAALPSAADRAPPPPSGTAARAPSVPSPTPTAGRVGPPVEEDAPDPVAVAIPAVGVAAPVVGLGLDDAGRLEVPTDFAEAGWFRDGPEPGEAGTAVIVGHVDSTRGPAVFFRLDELRPGDEIVVRRADGSRRSFLVRRLERWPKDEFPTDRVYDSAGAPELRLITCGGQFDRERRSYQDNVVVFADATPA